MKYDEKTLNKLIGVKFGKLKVIDYRFNETGRQVICKVQCECGSEPKEYPLYALTWGKVKSCGCSRKPNAENSQMGRKKKDITNMVIDKLTILSEDPITLEGKIKCECGNIFTVPHVRKRISLWKKQGAKCPKCVKAEMREKTPLKYGDLKPGDKFGKLTVLKKVDNVKQSRYGANYECQCECGKKKYVLGTYLIDGRIKSCGCIKSTNFGKRNMNGLTQTEEGKELYKIWLYYTIHFKRKDLKWIQTQNVKFFPEWSNKEKGFVDFYNWANFGKDKFDINERPILMRIDETKDFSPENCYFAKERISK